MGLFDDLIPQAEPAAAPAPPGAQAPVAALDPAHRDLLIRTVLGEAGAEPDDGQSAVAAVIKNRLNSGKFGGDIPGVVLAKNQFEPWSTREGRATMMAHKPDSPAYQRAAANVDRVFGDEGFDPTGGATYFFAPKLQADQGRPVPSFAKGEPVTIGGHAFYGDAPPVSEVSSQAKPAAAKPVAETTKSPPGMFDDLIPSDAAPADGGRLRITVRPKGVDDPALPTNSPSAGSRFMDDTSVNVRAAREGASPPVATKSTAAFEGLANSATFNFRDEMKGLLAAGGFDFDKPDSPADIALMKGAYKLATGDPDAVAAYRVATSEARDKAQRQQEQQPGAYLAGELGGAALTLPVGGAAPRAATLPARIAAGTRGGALVGSLNAAGEGTDPLSRVTKGATGLVTGATIGAVSPVAVEGVVQGARALTKPLQPLVQAIRGIRDPDAEASRRVATAIQRDIRSTQPSLPGLSAPEFAASVNSGGPAAVMDLGGETTRALARSAANTSPEGRAALNGMVNDRFESQSDRVSGWLNRTFGPTDRGATREALSDAAQRANRPAYQRAYNDGDRPLWSPELQRLVSSPDVVDAMRAAAEKGKSRAVTDGFGGFNSSVQISPTGVVQFKRGPNGQPTYPNLQFWDGVKRELDQKANVARRAGANEDASVYGRLATSLRGELDGLVPTYQNARAGAARFFGANDALEAGEKFLASNAPIADARRAFAAMSAPEQDLFRHGFVSSLVQKIETTGDRRNILNSIVRSPRAREQMALAMGPQRSREFEAMMRAEGVMDMARTAVQGNSTTARQLTELGLAGGTYGLGTGGDLTNPNPTALMTAALVWGATKGKGAIDRRVAQRVAEMLTSQDPAVLRRGVALLARNTNLLSGLRSFDRSVVRLGTQEAPKVAPQLQGTVAGHADADQPN